jgi:hypothetical protein
MSELSHQKNTPRPSQQPAVASSGGGKTEVVSNAEVAEEARSPEGTAAGLANYQATLGQWLGEELYQAVAPHLTLKKMEGAANKALMGVFGSLMGELEKIDPANNKADIEKFSAAFKREFGGAAGDWIKEDGADMVAGVAGWVDANPELIATAALLAAAGAYLADASLPELTTTMGLGEDLKLKLGAKIGSLQNIALEQITAEISHATAPLVAAMKIDTSGETTKTEFSGSYGDVERKLTVDGQLEDSNLTMLGVQGLTTFGDKTLSGGFRRENDTDKINVDLKTKDGNTTRITGVDYNPDSGLLTLRNVLSEKQGDASAKINSSVSSNGSRETGLALSGPVAENLMGTLSLSEGAKRLGAQDSYQLSDHYKASLGLDYDTKDLDAAFKYSTSSTNDHSADGSLDYKFGEGFETGFDATKSWGNTENHEVGAYFGFRNPDAFETYLGKYRFKSADGGSHHASLMVEQELGDIRARLTQTLNHSASSTDWSTMAQGAYAISDNVALIGQAEYTGNSLGEHHVIPGVGIQVRDVPLVVTHDIQTGSTQVMVTLKFDF